MKKILTPVLILISISVLSQSNDRIQVLNVVNRVFEAMRTSDSTLLKSSFVENPNTFTAFIDQEGKSQLITGDFQRFINAVGQPKEQIWNEPIWNEKIDIDGNIASVWVDYAFYVDDNFSHCGVDAFHLIKQDGDWKIFHLVDTRRKVGCDVPPLVNPNKERVTSLTSSEQMNFHGLKVDNVQYKGKRAFSVSTVEGNSEDGYATIKDLNFQNGTIEVEVIGKPKESAPSTARGFIGVAFRAKNDAYECIYIRPTNSTASNQIRRNHSVQYVSHPEYPWHRLRKEETKKYEAYAPIEFDEWTKLRIEVEGETARLFINNSEQPYLVVNDLKLGKDRSGGVGFWTFSTTEAYFSNLKVYAN